MERSQESSHQGSTQLTGVTPNGPTVQDAVRVPEVQPKGRWDIQPAVVWLPQVLRKEGDWGRARLSVKDLYIFYEQCEFPRGGVRNQGDLQPSGQKQREVGAIGVTAQPYRLQRHPKSIQRHNWETEKEKEWECRRSIGDQISRLSLDFVGVSAEVYTGRDTGGDIQEVKGKPQDDSIDATCLSSESSTADHIVWHSETVEEIWNQLHWAWGHLG